jgi:transcriptional regulator with XRE-family HTH domain
VTLKQIRMRRGLSQAELARLSGVTVKTISSIECGKTAQTSTILKICRVLEIELDDLEGVKLSTYRV